MDNPDDRDLAATYPALDAVDSRWWYWIAAYLVVAVLFVPFVAVAAFAFLVPTIVVGPGSGPAVGAPIAVAALLFAFLVFVFVVAAFVVSVLLPVALYMDARRVAQADLDWEPDPVVYGALGLLQFVVTPLVGLVVALYYLYQRHEHVGVP